MTNKEIMTSSVLMENNNGQQATQQQQTQHIERSYYNPSRRKATHREEDASTYNRASTYNMNRYQSRICGKHNGCPWRPTGFVYQPGAPG